MVRDGSSGNDDRLTGEPDEASADSPSPGEAHDVPNQLTQELARLLAASIAQSQGSKGFPLGVPTGSDLASLASLVSAASGQRTLAPVFKDGLSALAYGPPQSRPESRPTHVLPPPEPEPPLDDEPMPIPSTWREPGSYDDDRWFRQQLGATLLGLFAGLLVVVPAVLWLSGWIGPERTSKSGSTRDASAIVRPTESKVAARTETRTADAAAAQYVTGSVESRGSVDSPASADSRGSIEIRKPEPPVPVPVTQPAAAPTPPPAPAPKVDERAQIEEIITRAMQRAETGDVMGAREMLVAAQDATPGGHLTFALAETYDPNKLAAWGTRSRDADAVKARDLYTKALHLGVTRAQMCLEALKP